MMTRFRVGGCFVLACLAACGGSSDPAPELQQLQSELRAVKQSLAETHAREEEAVRRHQAMREAFTPLQGVLEASLREQGSKQERWRELSEAIRGLVDVLRPAPGSEQEKAITALKARLATLETSQEDLGKRHAKERDLILQAINATVEKLDAFLERVQKIEAARHSGGEENAVGGGRSSKSGFGQDLLLPVLGVATVVLLLVVLVILFPGAAGRHGRVAVVPLAASHPVKPGEERSGAGPSEIALDIPHAEPERGASELERWLREDPRVLVEPEPRVTAKADRLCVRFAIAADTKNSERLRLDAELRARMELSQAKINGAC